MSVAVLGASGYLGRYVTDELLDRGRAVVAVDLEPGDRLVERAAEPELMVRRGDITTFADVSDVLVEHDVRDVIQLAYFGAPETGLLHAAEEYPYKASIANVSGVSNVLEAGRQLDLARLVIASSTVVYGPPSYYERLGIDPVDETAPTGPESLYGACKEHNEFLAEMYREEYGMQVACLRLPLIYGPRRYPGAQPFIVDMFETAADGGTITVGGGDSTWDLLYERDIGPLFAETLEATPYEHPSYNVVGHTTTVRELAELARKYGHPDAEITVEPGDTAPLPAPLVDERLRSDVGFQPEYDTETAVADYLDTLEQ